MTSIRFSASCTVAVIGTVRRVRPFGVLPARRLLVHGDRARDQIDVLAPTQGFDFADAESDCHASEVTLPTGRADCIMATDDTCLVIELKPRNSRAISRGTSQSRGNRDDLNNEWKKPSSDVIKKLIDAKSDFSKCKSFEFRVDCYTLCPDINEDNEFRDARVDRRKDCS